MFNNPWTTVSKSYLSYNHTWQLNRSSRFARLSVAARAPVNTGTLDPGLKAHYQIRQTNVPARVLLSKEYCCQPPGPLLVLKVLFGIHRSLTDSFPDCFAGDTHTASHSEYANDRHTASHNKFADDRNTACHNTFTIDRHTVNMPMTDFPQLIFRW